MIVPHLPTARNTNDNACHAPPIQMHYTAPSWGPLAVFVGLANIQDVAAKNKKDHRMDALTIGISLCKCFLHETLLLRIESVHIKRETEF